MLPQAATKSLASPLAGELASRLSAMTEEGEGQVADAPLPQPGAGDAYKNKNRLTSGGEMGIIKIQESYPIDG